MPQFLGTTPLAALYLGTTPIQVLYLGTVIVWQNEIVYTVSSTVTDFNPATVFGADWAAAKNKRLINASGNAINTLIVNSAFGGNFIIENRGIISGRGGLASAVGGNAIANTTGLTIQLINASGATIRSGGGGGGSGEATGTGPVRDPTSGNQYKSDGAPLYYFYVDAWGQLGVYWNSTAVYFNYPGGDTTGITSYVSGIYTYHRGTLRQFIPAGYDIFGNDSPDTWIYDIYRTYMGSTTVATVGGRGQGHDGANAAGGTNAGTGGTYGNAGAAGNTGAGGLAGYAYTGAFSVTNNGTVQGRT